MNHTLFRALAVATIAGAALAPTAGAGAQEPPVVAAPLTPAQVNTLARAYTAISALRDQVQAELAEPKNKKVEIQLELREKLRVQTERILREHALTRTEYDRMTFVVSTDVEQRRQFDAAVTQLAAKKDPG